MTTAALRPGAHLRPAARVGAVRHLVVGSLVLGVEVWTYLRYAAYGAQFHFWLHLLIGLAVAFVVLTAWRLARPRAKRRAGPFEAGFAGHLYSAVPDVLFLALGVLHARWMDVFALHITAHFLWPTPLGAGLLLVATTLTGYVAVTLGLRRLAAGALLATGVALGAADALRAPLPTTLQQVRHVATHSTTPGGWGWICGVDTGRADSAWLRQAIRDH